SVGADAQKSCRRDDEGAGREAEESRLDPLIGREALLEEVAVEVGPQREARGQAPPGLIDGGERARDVAAGNADRRHAAATAQGGIELIDGARRARARADAGHVGLDHADDLAGVRRAGLDGAPLLRDLWDIDGRANSRLGRTEAEAPRELLVDDDGDWIVDGG